MATVLRGLFVVHNAGQQKLSLRWLLTASTAWASLSASSSDNHFVLSRVLASGLVVMALLARGGFSLALLAAMRRRNGGKLQ